MANVDIWWSSITVAQKERIARKANQKEVPYPECTRWWLSLPEERKQKIHDHCVDSHGLFLRDWNDGNPFTD